MNAEARGRVGAFLQAHPCAAVAGVHRLFAERHRLDQQIFGGRFFCWKAKKIAFPETSFNFVFLFGVFFYFEKLDYAEAALRKMFRVARPRARIFIRDVSEEENICGYDAPIVQKRLVSSSR